MRDLRYEQGELADFVHWVDSGYKDSVAKEIVLELVRIKQDELRREYDATLDLIKFKRLNTNKPTVT